MHASNESHTLISPPSLISLLPFSLFFLPTSPFSTFMSLCFVLAPEFNQGHPCNHGSKTIQGSWRAHGWMDHWWWVCGLESHSQHSIVPSGKGNSAAPSPFTMSCCPVLCKPSEDNQKGYDFTVVKAVGCSKDSAVQLVSLPSLWQCPSCLRGGAKMSLVMHRVQ